MLCSVFLRMEFINLLLIGIVSMILVLILTVFMYLVYCGLLHDVRVTTTKPPIGQFTVVYKFEQGPYKNCSYTFTEASSLSRNLKIFGIYYDNPKIVNSLCSFFGSVLMLKVECICCKNVEPLLLKFIISMNTYVQTAVDSHYNDTALDKNLFLPTPQ